MIAGATRSAGGPALAIYLMHLGDNETVRLGRSRGLLATALADQVAELDARAARGRSPKPLSHVWASPDPLEAPWTERDWRRYWQRYEAEFDLGDQPLAEVVHIKLGREHRHRVYLLIQANGRCIRTSHDHVRREYLSRLTEHLRGDRLIAGRHNRAIHQRLLVEGQNDFAAAIRKAGLLGRTRPKATSPAQRRRDERLSTHEVAVKAELGGATM